MIATDKFVFLHLLRSGGTFVSQVIKNFFPSAHEIGYHLPRCAIPPEYAHLPILGTVRDPWEFYVSWYYHHLSGTRYLPLFCTVSENRTLDFEQTIRNTLELGITDKHLNAIIGQLPETFDYEKRHIANVTRDMMAQIRGTGLGLYTFRFNQMFGQADEVYFCRLGSLRTDLLKFFRRIGVETPGLQNYVLGLEKQNTSDHVDYAKYYSDDLAHAVSKRDRSLIDRFGFRWCQEL